MKEGASPARLRQRALQVGDWRTQVLKVRLNHWLVWIEKRKDSYLGALRLQRKNLSEDEGL
jgi:hypothetical protein